MQKIRVGIIGCGEVTQTMHGPSLHQLAELFEVTALCDLSADIMATLGERWGVSKRYPDYHHLLADDAVDAVLVANPAVYHAEVAVAAARLGKHVMLEKPMCYHPGDADRVEAARLASGVVIQIAYMRRYDPAFLLASQQVKDMGPIRRARVHSVIGENPMFTKNTSRVIRGHDLPPGAGETIRNLSEQQTHEAIGPVSKLLHSAYGLLLGLSSHDLSAMRELIGAPRGVLYAACHGESPTMSAALDYGSFVCHFETHVDKIPRFDCHLEIFGNERVIKLQYNTPYVRNLPTLLTITEANGRGGVLQRTEHPAWGDSFVSEWEAFHRSITTGAPCKTTPADAKHELLLYQEMIRLMAKE